MRAWQPARLPRRLVGLVARGYIAGALTLYPLALPLIAQTPDGTPEARARMASIAAELNRHTRGLGRDSPRGIREDSAGGARERIARYVAEEFARLGLQPFSSPTGAWVQRFPRPGQMRFDYSRSMVRFMTVPGAGRTTVVAETGSDWDAIRFDQANFVTAAHFLPEAGRPLLRQARFESWIDWSANFMGSARVVILAGPHTPATLARLELRDRVVVSVPPAGMDSAAYGAVLTQLAGQSRGVLVAREEDSAAFARAAAATRRPVPLIEAYLWNAVVPDGAWRWAVALRPAALAALWGAADVDVAALGRAATPVVRDVPGVQAWLVAEPDSSDASRDSIAGRTLPYVAGLLEGTDSVLKRQYVVVTADLSGEDVTGLAGLLAVARAFSQPDARPRRSVVFVATSDGPPLSAGSWFFARAGRFVAALTLDRLSPAAGSTVRPAVTVDGGREVTLTVTPERLTAARPELDLAVADSGTVFRSGTAAEAYARNGVPSLALYVGAPKPDSTPSAGALNVPDSMARITLLAFYLGEELANRPSRPRWTAVGQQRYHQTLPFP